MIATELLNALVKHVSRFILITVLAALMIPLSSLLNLFGDCCSAVFSLFRSRKTEGGKSPKQYCVIFNADDAAGVGYAAVRALQGDHDDSDVRVGVILCGSNVRQLRSIAVDFPGVQYVAVSFKTLPYEACKSLKSMVTDGAMIVSSLVLVHDASDCLSSARSSIHPVETLSSAQTTDKIVVPMAVTKTMLPFLASATGKVIFAVSNDVEDPCSEISRASLRATVSTFAPDVNFSHIVVADCKSHHEQRRKLAAKERKRDEDEKSMDYYRSGTESRSGMYAEFLTPAFSSCMQKLVAASSGCSAVSDDEHQLLCVTHGSSCVASWSVSIRRGMHYFVDVFVPSAFGIRATLRQAL